MIQSTTDHHSRTWFSQMVEKSQRSGRHVDFYTITPDIARQILEYNPDNRTVLRENLKELITAFKNGRFVCNGQSIIISEEGLLNDGQHRLIACIEADKSFESVVAFGLPRSARFVTDIGRVRDKGTMMSMAGVPNGKKAAAVVGQYLLYDADIYHFATTGLISAEDDIEFYFANEKLVERAMDWTKTKNARTLGASALAAAYIILYKNTTDRMAVDSFYAQLVEGIGLTKGSPILALRNRLTNNSVTLMRNHIRIELILRAWNSWRTGEKRDLIRTVGAYPEDIER